ncbi:MAG: ABC transporter substrate-binding protein [Acetobacteraceae bacterium]|jgi:branched-chain amino acid transport system substrate-binding protein
MGSGNTATCFVATAALLVLGSGALAETQRGVTDTEILVGTITDLSGVTAVQGVNNANAVRLAFDEVNEKGGINGRKIRYIVEDSQYQVPRSVQAINKLINNDGVFFTIEDGGTPMNNATFPMAIEKNVPKLLPLSAARSMFEPFNRLKFSQYSSYVDQMRAGVKYFVEQRGKKAICAMYQDTDFGKDVLAGAQMQAEAMGMKIVATTAHKPTDTDFTAAVAKLREANCDLITMGTIVRDSTLIIATVKKVGWKVDLLGQVASYDTAIAEAPGNVADGFYSMSPSLYAYPDDPRPAIKAFTQKYKARYGVDVNYLGEMGYTSAQIAIEALQRAGRDLTVDSLVKSMESIHDFHDLFGGTYSFSATNHHGATAAFLSVVHDGRWEPVVDHALVY